MVFLLLPWLLRTFTGCLFGCKRNRVPVSYDEYCSEVAEIPKKSERGGHSELP